MLPDIGSFEGVFFLIYLVVVVVPIWRIVGRAGFSPWFSLLAIVPLVNVAMLFVFAFSRWPLQARVPASTFE